MFATTLHKLIFINTYKNFIAAFLLAVYTFIATPVQVWHHHDYAINVTSENLSKEKLPTESAKSSNQLVDANCKICSHNYSIFIDVEDVTFKEPYIVFQSRKEYYIFSIPSTPYLSFSNKGPPAIA